MDEKNPGGSGWATQNNWIFFHVFWAFGNVFIQVIKPLTLNLNLFRVTAFKMILDV